MKVARNEKRKKLLGFSFYKNIGNFEAFLWNLNLSAKHLFWRCEGLPRITKGYKGLLMVTKGYLRLPQVTASYRRLPQDPTLSFLLKKTQLFKKM